MFPYLAPWLTTVWGPFRLLGSYLVLIGTGAFLAAFAVWKLLPLYWRRLPRDQGKPFVREGEEAKGKPTGAGFLILNVALPILFLVMPFGWKFWELVGCLYLAMLTGYLDDCSETHWGEWLKGSLDLLIACLASLALCQGNDYVVWLPLVKGAAADGSILLPLWLFMPLSTILLWIAINTTNCTDGVDGLAGSLTLLALFYLGGFLYGIVGHVEVAEYLLLPHNPAGARWAILVFTVTGGLMGYLWHNAKPSAVLMGDAGSRSLGLLLGMAAMAAGNPFLIAVVAPVILVNGGSGLVKIVLLRGLNKLGFDARPPNRNLHNAEAGRGANAEEEKSQHPIIRLLHKYRFPLHDHCRSNLGWTDSQVLLRFVLLQALATPILLGLFIKLR